DATEHIIEVVGNAAGQLSNGLHLLRLLEVLFKVLSFCNIFGDATGPIDSAGLIADRETAVQYPADGVVWTPDPVFYTDFRKALAQVGESNDFLCPGLRQNRNQPNLGKGIKVGG